MLRREERTRKDGKINYYYMKVMIHTYTDIEYILYESTIANIIIT